MATLQQFKVVTSDCGASSDAFHVAITSPSGNFIKPHLIPFASGFLVNFIPCEVGQYLISICGPSGPVSPSPHRMYCTMNVHESKLVYATGHGLSFGIAGESAEFCVDTLEAGHGALSVQIEGPCEVPIEVRDNGDGTCSVSYLPTLAGEYIINVAFNGQHINSSPFSVDIHSTFDTSGIRVKTTAGEL